MNNNLQNKAEETEILTADEKKISEFVGSLERVSAPNDFEFRLKARIAAGKEESYQAGYWQWLRYLLPVGASAFVLAFVLYGTNFFAPSVPTERAAEAQSNKSEEIKTPPIETPSNMIVANSSNSNKAEGVPVNPSGQKDALPQSVEQEPILLVDRTILRKTEPQPKTTPDDNFNGSRVLGRNPVNKQILPRGIETNKIIPKPQEFENSGKTNIAEMLKINGMETVSEGGKLKVKSIQPNSVAERSDVKTGDIIESFDEQKANGNSNSSNLGGARKLTVSRDGKIITIDLKPH